MNELRSTIREILVAAEQEFGGQDAFRYKVKGNKDGGKKEVKPTSSIKRDSGLISSFFTST